MADKRDNAKKENFIDKLKRKSAEKRTKSSECTEITGFMRAVPVIMIAAALFLTLCFVTAETGAFGKFISEVLTGLFSYMAYTIPAFITLHAIFFYNDVKEGKLGIKIFFSCCALVMLSMVAYIIPNIASELVFNAKDFYNDGKAIKGGGFIGSAVAFMLARVIGKVGVIIVIALAIALYALYLINGGGSNLSRFFLKKIGKIANYFAELEVKSQKKKKDKHEEKLVKQRAVDDKKNADFYNDEYFNADNGVSRLEIPELGILETKTGTAGSPCLRETVIKDNETATDDIKSKAPMQDKKHFADVKIDSKQVFVRTDIKAEGFHGGDIIYEEAKSSSDSEKAFEFESKASSGDTYNAKKYNVDDSADSVFTASFDPFDLAMNEKRASRPSSRAAELEKDNKAFSEFISDMTPEQFEKKRRLDEFERSRRAAIEKKAAREAAEQEAMQKAAEAQLAKQTIQKAEPVIAENNADLKTASPKVEHMSTQTVSPKAEEIPAQAVYAKNEEITVQAASQKAEQTPEQAPSSAFSAEEEREKEQALLANLLFNPDAEGAKKSYEENTTVYNRPMGEAHNATSSLGFAQSSQTLYHSHPQLDDLPKSSISFETDDTLIADTPVSEHSAEFDFDTPGDTTALVQDVFSDSEPQLEVSRTMLDPTLDPIADTGRMEFDFDSDDEEDADEYLSDDELEEEDIVEKHEIPESERNPEIYAQRQMFDVFKNDNMQSSSYLNKEHSENVCAVDYEASDDEADEYDMLDENEETEDEPPFDDYTEDEDYDVPTPVQAPKKEEKKKSPAPDFSSYRFPPLELLKKSEEEDWDSINKEIQYGGEQLINTLDSFNIKATIRGMEHGPRITRYSIVPAKGVRVNQIEKLADDIALALAAESIRIEAPIPGKSAVGVEVPNKVPSLVSLRDLLEAEEFQSEASKTCVCIGKSVEGSLVYGDLGSMPHVLIAGATGMGKSVCINSLITSMLYKARPDEVKFIMIDPKKVEFAPYNGIPHLLVPVVTEPKQAAGALMWAVDEMTKRYDIIEKLCVKSIDSYNKKVTENPELGAPMSKIVIFIDELNDLMVQVRDPVENLIMLIAQKARAAGIHLVIGTQRPSVDVITGVIKANIPSRIACKVSSGIDSRTIIEQTGAEKLIGKGDMLFAPSGKAPKRVQGAFVSESETEAIVDFIKAQFKGEHYDEQALEDMKRAAQKCDKSKSGDGMDDDYDDENSGLGFLQDQKFLNAVELAIRNGSVATSFLQRKLKIGYGKAAQYIDIMEDQGIVGEKNGAKAREVKMTMEEWRELLNRRLDN